MGLATSVETLGVDLRTRTKQLGAKEKARRKKCDVMFARRNRAFQKQPFEDEEVAQDVLGSCESLWIGQTVGTAPTERPKLTRQMAAAGKKESVSFSLHLRSTIWSLKRTCPLATLFCAEGLDGKMGKECIRRSGGSRFLKCRHGDR